MNNNTVKFNYENQVWFFDAATGRFIGPARTVKPHHPLYCRLEAVLKTQQNAPTPAPAVLEVGAL